MSDRNSSHSPSKSTTLLSPADVMQCLERVRLHRPRVHCITNAVAQELSANVLLALGAIPSMTIAAEEVEAFAASADALLVNLGTLDDVRRAAIPLAIRGARASARPMVLDPVFIERSPVRCAYAQEILKDPLMRPDVVKANPGEVACLSGLDDLLGDETFTLAVTGAEDLIRQAGQELCLQNGTGLLSRVTATGCSLGAVIGAFVSQSEDPLLGTASAVAVFNISAEMAAEKAEGPGSLVPAFLDQLYRLEERDIAARLTQSGASVGAAVSGEVRA